MEYLIQERFVYLVLAFVLGAVIGWVVCNQGASKRIAALEAQLSGNKPGTPVESIDPSELQCLTGSGKFRFRRPFWRVARGRL